MNMWDDGKEEIEDGDEEENLDGQACKGRGRLHHQGVVGRLWVGGALGLGGGQLGASSGQGARAGWRGPKLPDSSRLPAASRDHLGRWQRITKWSPAPASTHQVAPSMPKLLPPRGINNHHQHDRMNLRFR